jgi:hypothetical protein
MRFHGDVQRRTRRRREASTAIAEDDRELLGLMISESQVGPAIPIEITNGNIVRVRPGGYWRTGRNGESSLAITRVHRGIATLFVRNHDIQSSIGVQIGDNDGSRPVSNRKP